MAVKYSRAEVLQMLDDDKQLDEVIMEGSDVELEYETDSSDDESDENNNGECMYDDMSDIEGASEGKDSEEPNRNDEWMDKTADGENEDGSNSGKGSTNDTRESESDSEADSRSQEKTTSVENLKWTKNYKKVKVREFSEESGPTTSLPGSVLHIFLMFFTQELMEMIVDQSNLYAATTMGEAYDQWTKITVDELKAYFGFLILMGLVPLPSMYDYWSRSQTFHYSPIADRIPRDRFLDIHKFLHFVNNTSLSPYGSPNYNKLGKVQPVIDYLNTKFLEVYNPHQNISIDEAMIKFKGRSSMKQYMPKKPIKRGFKVWVRADAENGYISELDVYIGKKGDKIETGLGQSVVEKLTEKLVGKYYHIYFDNFFSSITLFQSLSQRKLYGCGTMVTNRKGFPTELKKLKNKSSLNRGESVIVQSGDIVITLWQDTKPVLCISNNAQPTETVIVSRKRKDGSKIEITCPKALKMYNTYMGGVDLNDQLRKYYNFNFKSRKSYKYIFFFLFQLAITNSFILSKQYTNLGIKSIKKFREILAVELIGPYNSRKRPGRPLVTGVSKKPSLSHFPLRGAEKTHRCYYCSHILKQRKETIWHCKDCNKFLCHKGTETDCFYLYHKTL